MSVNFFVPAISVKTTGKEGWVLEIGGKKSVHTRLDFEAEFEAGVELDNKVQNLEDKFKNHDKYFDSEIGYWLPKDLLQNKNMIMINLICAFSYIVKPEVKKALGEAGFENQEFKPVWIGKNLDCEPPFWLWYHTGERFNYSLDSKLGENKWYLPKELQASLKDLNRVFLDNHHHSISPKVLSEKVVEVLKLFKDIKFYPIEFI